MCIVPSNSAGARVGGQVSERARREEDSGQQSTSGLDGNLGQMQPGRLSPRGLGQSGRRRGVQAAAAPQPLPLPLEPTPANGRAGRAISSSSGGRLAGPPRLVQKIPRPVPITNTTSRACDQSSGRPGVTATFRDRIARLIPLDTASGLCHGRSRSPLSIAIPGSK